MTVEPVSADRAPQRDTEPQVQPSPTDLLDGLFVHATVADLRRTYGADVGKVTILVNEVGELDYVALYPDTPREIVLDVTVDAGDLPFQSVSVRRRDGPWATRAGVKTGVTLEALERLNGGPFTLGPSPEGVEARFDGPGLAGHYVVLGRDGDIYVDLGPLQDWETRSDAPAVRALGLTVHEVTLRRP